MATTPGLEFKFADGGNTVEGYAARFHERDLGGDVIDSGSFTKTIAAIRAANHKLPMLLAHDQAIVIGSWDTLREDADGLVANGQINVGVTAGKEALSLVKGGDLSGLSIGFDIPAGGARMEGGVRHLTEIRLHEISLVAVPLAPRARISLKDFSDLKDYSTFLQSAGVPRRDAEYIARKSWPAITAGDQPEIDIEKVLARMDAHAADRKSWR